jgi:hypothetical protein
LLLLFHSLLDLEENYTLSFCIKYYVHSFMFMDGATTLAKLI